MYIYLDLAYKPASNDVNGLLRVLDANNDGRVTIEDLEAMCIKYLCDSINVSS